MSVGRSSVSQPASQPELEMYYGEGLDSLLIDRSIRSIDISSKQLNKQLASQRVRQLGSQRVS